MLEFEEGQCLVKLDENAVLSVLNSDRQKVLDEAKIWSVSYMRGAPWPDIMADESTWEVALLVENMISEIPEFKRYEDNTENNPVYAYVPHQVVLDYIKENQDGSDEGVL